MTNIKFQIKTKFQNLKIPIWASFRIWNLFDVCHLIFGICVSTTVQTESKKQFWLGELYHPTLLPTDIGSSLF